MCAGRQLSNPISGIGWSETVLGVTDRRRYRAWPPWAPAMVAVADGGHDVVTGVDGDPGVLGVRPEGWRLAEPGYEFRFPQDDGPHPDYQTEWWYLTGNLQTAEGREFGYELTFFRYGYRSPSQRTPVKSRFVMDDVKFAHFTITDVRSGDFHVSERTSRGAYGDAGFLSGSHLAWIGDWELNLGKQFEAKAENADDALI